MVEYDRSVLQAEKELLLLNIARLEDHQPPHFTVTSNIAATFDFRMNSGLSARLLEGGGTAINPNAYTLELGSSVAENPTISIIPIQGQEFTERILTPLDSHKFQFLLIQGQDLQQLLRLTARGMELREADASRVIINSPRKPHEYEEFRRIVLHLAALEQARQLYLVPLDYRQRVAFPLEHQPSSAEMLQAIREGFLWSREPNGAGYILSKEQPGRLALTNYPGTNLSNEERERWNQDLATLPPNIVVIDIRPSHPGGAYTLRGHIRLRSFNEMLAFLGEGIRQFPEFPVEPDPRTGPVQPNPERTLAIETGTPPSATEALLQIQYEGETFWIPESKKEQPQAAWNQQVFALLYHIFQMTVTDVSKVLTPAITIAK